MTKIHAAGVAVALGFAMAFLSPFEAAAAKSGGGAGLKRGQQVVERDDVVSGSTAERTYFERSGANQAYVVGKFNSLNRDELSRYYKTGQ